MATLKEKSEEMARIKAELQRMEDTDDTTEENDGDLRDTLVERWQQLDTECKPIIERMEKVRAITRAASDETNLERPDGTPYAGGTPDLVVRNRRDPYGGMQEVGAHMVRTADLRERALDAVELENKQANLIHDHAENVTRMIQNNPGRWGRGIYEHILLTGSQEYQEAFRAYVEHPTKLPGEQHDVLSRTALALSGVTGIMLPYVLDPTIILTNTGSANPWRRISNVKQTTSNTWNGVASAGVTAGWLAEGTIAVDSTPAVSHIIVTPLKASAWVFGSYEVLEDTDFGQQLPRLLADAKDRLEEAAFATGNGSTAPQGAVNGATTVYTTATTLVIALADVYGTQAALVPRFRNAPQCAWVANVAIINKFRQLDTAGGASFWTNLGKGQPETLLGAPIYESTTMASALTSTNLLAIFGDFAQFIIVDRVGVSLIYEPLVKATAGILPAGQAGWFMFWRTGSALSTVNGFVVMKGL